MENGRISNDASEKKRPEPVTVQDVISKIDFIKPKSVNTNTMC